VERGEDARLVVLAMITGEHILLLGSPGTAKSVLGQRLATLCNGKFFQRLLTRFTTPEELFGPLSLKSLEQDEYRRCTTGFLPTADIAFLDEIFKANSAILNTLLTILNERKFDNAGGRETCPIRCVVGASNELPESDDLVALFDRFLIRKEVSPVSDEGVLALLELTNPGAPFYQSSKNDGDADQHETVFTDGLDRVIDSLTTAAASVVMDRDAAEMMRDLRSYLRQELSVQVSDRRLVKASRLLKICAASNGRCKVDPIDFFVLQHCFWNVPEERTRIRDWLWGNLTPGSSTVEQFRFLLESLRTEIVAVVRRTSGDVSGQGGARSDDLVVLQSLLEELKSIQGILEQKVNSLARHMELVRQAGDSLWLDRDDAIAMHQLLLPKATSVLAELRRATLNALTLEAALSPLAVPDDLRLDTILALWEEGDGGEVCFFTEEEISLSMREAKSKYDPETFRRWKRTKKKAEL
jgi:MoxR-like ATPase